MSKAETSAQWLARWCEGVTDQEVLKELFGVRNRPLATEKSLLVMLSSEDKAVFSSTGPKYRICSFYGLYLTLHGIYLCNSRSSNLDYYRNIDHLCADAAITREQIEGWILDNKRRSTETSEEWLAHWCTKLGNDSTYAETPEAYVKRLIHFPVSTATKFCLLIPDPARKRIKFALRMKKLNFLNPTALCFTLHGICVYSEDRSKLDVWFSSIDDLCSTFDLTRETLEDWFIDATYLFFKSSSMSSFQETSSLKSIPKEEVIPLSFTQYVLIPDRAREKIRAAMRRKRLIVRKPISIRFMPQGLCVYFDKNIRTWFKDMDTLSNDYGITFKDIQKWHEEMDQGVEKRFEPLQESVVLSPLEEDELKSSNEFPIEVKELHALLREKERLVRELEQSLSYSQEALRQVTFLVRNTITFLSTSIEAKDLRTVILYVPHGFQPQTSQALPTELHISEKGIQGFFLTKPPELYFSLQQFCDIYKINLKEVDSWRRSFLDK